MYKIKSTETDKNWAWKLNWNHQTCWTQWNDTEAKRNIKKIITKPKKTGTVDGGIISEM